VKITYRTSRFVGFTCIDEGVRVFLPGQMPALSIHSTFSSHQLPQFTHQPTACSLS